MFGLLKKIFKPEEVKKAPPLKKNLIGTISHYYGKAGAAVLKVKTGPLTRGETVRIYGKHVDYEQTVTTLEIDRKPIEKARKGQEVGMGVKKKVHEGDGIYRIPEEKA